MTNSNTFAPASRKLDGLPVWIDYKYRAKKKCSQNLLSLKKTGGGPSEEVPISELEEIAIQVASLRTTVTGSSSQVFGAPMPNRESEEVKEWEQKQEEEEEDEVDEATYPVETLWEITNSPVPVDVEFDPAREATAEPVKRKSTIFGKSSTPKRVKRAEEGDDKTRLLKKQMQTDAQFQKDVLSLMKERNNRDAAFQESVLKLLAERNEIATKQEPALYCPFCYDFIPFCHILY